jgi:isopenicillin N synthase-like dioxygenase
MQIVSIGALLCEKCLYGRACGCLESEEKSLTLRNFSKALTSCGFVQITDHGISEAQLQSSFGCAAEFFGQSLEEKLQACSKDRARRGYSPAMTENFASLIGGPKTTNDSVEKFRIGPILSPEQRENNAGYYCSKDAKVHFFPNDDQVLEQDFSALPGLYTSMETLSKNLLKLICYCAGVGTHSLATEVDKHTSILSMNYFPAVEGTHPRIAAHTDVSLLTIVAQHAVHGDEAGGLEVQVQREDGSLVYIPVPYVPGSLVVNVGDCLQYWSEGLFKSAMHRVVTSTPSLQEHNCPEEWSRHSLAFFFSPNYNARLEWPAAEFSAIVSTAEEGESGKCADGTNDGERPVIDYTTWRKNHIKKAMEQLKSNSGHNS